MSTSLPPESGIPPSVDDVRYTTVEFSLEGKRRVTLDCIQRALDGLERDRPQDVDWLYVYEQLTRAQEQVVNAVLVVENSKLDDDDDDVDTPLVPECGHAATDGSEFIVWDGKGGEA